MHTITLTDAQLAVIRGALTDAYDYRSDDDVYCDECDSNDCHVPEHHDSAKLEQLYAVAETLLPASTTPLFDVKLSDLSALPADPVRVTLDDMVQAYSAGHEDGGRDLPCEFVDMLVQLYVAAGEVTAAESLIYCHHEADYHPDAYIGHYMPETDEDDDLSALRDAAAAAYVAAL